MQQNPESQVQTTQTSVSAVTSFVLGIMSPIVLCSCLPTILTSLMAIVLGHIALVKIGRSNGTLFGRWQAITGLVLGYIFLPLSLYLAPQFFKTPTSANLPPANPVAEFKARGFDDANSELSSKRNGNASGNSPEAIKLARQLSTSLSALINATIVEDGGWGEDKKLTKPCAVYCRLNDDSVCFLVKVPRYREFDDSAREAVEKLAWVSGRSTAANAGLPATSEMGIGLRGIFLYGSVMRGKINSSDPIQTTKSKNRLHSFFTESPTDRATP
ncbi:DUF4190 domain-containing protein [Mariniblastus sp.]|nr:DUF4190 domain-containing protein [Mariniblastus sp.]